MASSPLVAEGRPIPIGSDGVSEENSIHRRARRWVWKEYGVGCERQKSRHGRLVRLSRLPG